MPGHPDFDFLNRMSAEIIDRGGGREEFAKQFGSMLRSCIDDVIMTAKTGRRSYDELEKTEKTYIGTRVEIELKALLRLPSGRLDAAILGHDVDIKNTMGSNWMIPQEAVGSPCILIAADEETALCFFGLLVARADYLTKGKNRDQKRSVSATGFANIFWLFRELAYPPNFWRSISADKTERIFSGNSGNERMVTLFREVQERPIARDVIEAVAQQKDFMRRLRSDGKRGTRDRLASEGVRLLSGQYDQSTIQRLGLPHCQADEFISTSK